MVYDWDVISSDSWIKINFMFELNVKITRVKIFFYKNDLIITVFEMDGFDNLSGTKIVPI